MYKVHACIYKVHTCKRPPTLTHRGNLSGLNEANARSLSHNHSCFVSCDFMPEFMDVLCFLVVVFDFLWLFLSPHDYFVSFFGCFVSTRGYFAFLCAQRKKKKYYILSYKQYRLCSLFHWLLQFKLGSVMKESTFSYRSGTFMLAALRKWPSPFVPVSLWLYPASQWAARFVRWSFSSH